MQDIIRLGATGECVKIIQYLLAMQGYDVGLIDGVLGSLTDDAIRAFQTDNGLAPNGIVSQKTWMLLASKPSVNVVPPAQFVQPIQATIQAAQPQAGQASFSTQPFAQAYQTPPPTSPPDPRIIALEAHCKAQVGQPYIIGAQGAAYTESYIRARAKKSPSYFTADKLEWAVAQSKKKPGQHAYDCSGLFMAWAQETGMFGYDMSANSLWRKCDGVAKAEVLPGDMFFRRSGVKMVHVAILGYDGLYEAAGLAYGVVFRSDIFNRRTKNKMTGGVDKLRDWTHFGRLRRWDDGRGYDGRGYDGRGYDGRGYDGATRPMPPAGRRPAPKI